MDTNQAANRLRSLALQSAKRSKAAQLLDLFHEIEAALDAGVSQTTVIEELRAMGLDVNPGTFRSAMHRLRTRQTEPSEAMALQEGSTESAFGDTRSGAGPSSTFRGSRYDVEALS